MIFKKTALIGTLLCSALYASSFGNSFTQTQEQNTIKTVSDYKDLEQTLKRAGAKNEAMQLALAALYEKSWSMTDGNIAPKKKESIAIYESLSARGSTIANYKLGLISIEENNPNKALRYFEAASTKNIAAAVAYGTTALDYKMPTATLLKASSILAPMAEQYKTASSQFVLANIFNALHEESSANKYLTLACTNKKAPEEIKKICFSSADIAIYDKQKRQIVNEKNSNSGSCTE